MKDLPAEILNLIFEKETYDFNKYNIIQCQLTCKKWSQYVHRHLYRSVRIDKHTQLVNLLSTLSTKPNLGRYLETLRLGYWLEAARCKALLRILLLMCPKLEVIEGPYIRHFSVIYNEIREASERGGCRLLKKFPIIKRHPTTQSVACYSHALYSIRNSLEDVCVYGMMNPSTSTPTIMQSLNEFPKLRSLNIRIIHHFDSVYHIGRFTKNCPDFISLTIKQESPIDLEPTDIPYAEIVSDVQSTIPCPTVQSLDLDRIPVTENMMKYIMHAFPNINNLNMDPITVFDCCKSRFNTHWVRFLVYLNTIKNIITVDHLYMDDLTSVLNDYFNKIDFKGTLDIIYTDRRQSTPYMTYSKTQETEKRTIIAYLTSAQSERLPQLLQFAGVHINFLKYNAQSRYGSVHRNRHHLLLDQIFLQCPSMEKLKISFLSMDGSNPITQTNSTITELILTHCDLSLEFFVELSTRLPSLSNLLLVNHRRFNLWEKSCSYPISNRYGNRIASVPLNVCSNPRNVDSNALNVYSNSRPSYLVRGHSNVFPIGCFLYMQCSYSNAICCRDSNITYNTSYGNPNGNSNNGALYPPESFQDLSRVRHNYTIKMPNTSFDELTWQRDSSIDILPIAFKSINIKVETTTQTYYFYGVEKSIIAKTSEAIYQNLFDNPTVFSMYIQCHDIKKLYVSLLEHYWAINFTDA